MPGKQRRDLFTKKNTLDNQSEVICVDQKIRCAVIGVGRLGYWHAVNIATRISNAELASICDLDINKAKQAANELDIPHFTNDADIIMEDSSIKAVIIATSTASHYELLVKASEYNKDVFVEKPLTMDIEHAYEVQKLFTINNTVCQVGFMRRFDPAYDQAKKRITAGDIGEPIYYKGISRDPIAPHEEFVKKSGGIFVDVAIHDFDIARYLMGSEISSVLSRGKVLKNSFMENYNDVDQGLSYIEFASGGAGDVEVSRNAFYGYDIRAEVIGTEGTIFIGEMKHHSIYILNKSGKTHDIMPDFPDRFADAYFLEIKDFFNAVQEGRKPRVTTEDGVRALEIGLAARESIETQKKVSLHSKTNKVGGEIS